MRGGKVVRVCLGLAAAGAVVVIGAKIASEKLFEQPLVDGCSARVLDRTTRLSIEEAENAALISALSVQRGMPARAATIALATAFQESGLRNIDYGDRDSVGLFQQRPSQGWGTPEEILDPYYATSRFYTALAKIDGYDAMEIADAAQLVQNSADGGAYAQHEPGARALASSLTGETPAAFFCELREAPTTADPDALRSELAKAFGSSPDGARAGDVASRSRTTADGAGPDEVRTDGRGRNPGAGGDGAGGDGPGSGSGDDEEGTVDIPLGDTAPSYGWSVAQWAVAYSQRFGIVSVSYGERTWSAAESTKGWRQADQSAPAGRIRIVLATG
ncbi:hypothetical protein ABN028_31840 [Actinopolymorpha sp. B17G11]|uniref:hypothetical protein n=1 Tax=Actinopolymorpha sp. B17G11 TaxID=3160861 RepID=UPI0032E3FE66